MHAFYVNFLSRVGIGPMDVITTPMWMDVLGPAPVYAIMIKGKGYSARNKLDLCFPSPNWNSINNQVFVFFIVRGKGSSVSIENILRYLIIHPFLQFGHHKSQLFYRENSLHHFMHPACIHHASNN